MTKIQQIEEAVSVRPPLHILSSPKSDTAAQAARFHELVDREFLGTLTPDEEKELAVLTQWQEAQRNAFYKEFADGVEQDS